MKTISKALALGLKEAGDNKETPEKTIQRLKKENAELKISYNHVTVINNKLGKDWISELYKCLK